MQIVSWPFAGFVALVALVYYPLPRRLQNVWLLLASYAFYLTWAWQGALLLLALTLANFVLGRRLDPARRARAGLLWAGIGMNLLVLACFKYSDFFLPVLPSGGAGPAEAGAARLLLPVGLSYLVLQTISYLVDVRRGQMRPAADLLDFALYVAYFPKLLAGPIERARSMLPRLAAERTVDNERLARSVTLIVVGLLRKVVIADQLAAILSDRWLAGSAAGPLARLAVEPVVYGFYLYNDFAGYTGIVRGVSGLFGIELGPNFQQPFFARSFTEFWSRWHISLSHWLRDYVYFPVSRALLRRNPSPRWLPNVIGPPLVTMLASGMWHRASLPLLAWGALHGLYLAAERLTGLWRRPVRPDRQPRWRRAAAATTVFALTTLALLPFRAGLRPGQEVEALVRTGAGGAALGSTPLPWLGSTALLWIALTLAIDWVQYRHADEAAFLRWPRLAQAGALAAVLLAIFLASLGTMAGFVYQGF